MFFDHRLIARKGQLVSVLERLCQALELTPAQFTLAKTRYEGVGNWLAESDDVRLQQVAIYLQGSTALGTTVKPIRGNEHDIDLVCHMPAVRITHGDQDAHRRSLEGELSLRAPHRGKNALLASQLRQ